jgi:hypothetical protein
MRKRRQGSIVFLAFLGAMGLGGLLSPAARADHILYSIDVRAPRLHCGCRR